MGGVCIENHVLYPQPRPFMGVSRAHSAQLGSQLADLSVALASEVAQSHGSALDRWLSPSSSFLWPVSPPQHVPMTRLGAASPPAAPPPPRDCVSVMMAELHASPQEAPSECGKRGRFKLFRSSEFGSFKSMVFSASLPSLH